MSKSRQVVFELLAKGEISHLNSKEIIRHFFHQESSATIVTKLIIPSFEGKRPIIIIGKKEIGENDIPKKSVYFYPRAHFIKCVNLTASMLFRISNRHLPAPLRMVNLYDAANHRQIAIGDNIEIKISDVTAPQVRSSKQVFIYEYEVIKLRFGGGEVFIAKGEVRISP